MENQKLFISYTHVDKWLVNQLVETLRDGGYTVWYDHSLVPGKSWKIQLLDAIKNCDAFIYAMTPESITSEWCLWELKKAVGMSKPIIPVRLQTNIKLPGEIDEIQYADFTEGPTPQAVAKLLHAIRAASPIAPEIIKNLAPNNPEGIPPQATLPSTQEEPTPVSFFHRPSEAPVPDGPEEVNKKPENLVTLEYITAYLERYVNQDDFPKLVISSSNYYLKVQKFEFDRDPAAYARLQLEALGTRGNNEESHDLKLVGNRKGILTKLSFKYTPFNPLLQVLQDIGWENKDAPLDEPDKTTVGYREHNEKIAEMSRFWVFQDEIERSRTYFSVARLIMETIRLVSNKDTLEKGELTITPKL